METAKSKLTVGDTRQGNKFIADFLGWQYLPKQNAFKIPIDTPLKTCTSKTEPVGFESYQFQSNWNWMIFLLKRLRDSDDFSDREFFKKIGFLVARLEITLLFVNIVHYCKEKKKIENSKQ